VIGVVAGSGASGDDHGIHSPPRWAQLSYSSFDDGQGSGAGWHIKQTAGGLTGAEREALRAGVCTDFELAKPIPAFPTPADVEALPRKLRYVPELPGRACYWHATYAGADSTGRPGNVFTHALLDRQPMDTGTRFRPIELWRAARWLHPFGAEDVLAAELAAQLPPQPASAVNVDAVIGFLLDPEEWRLGVLSVLLDAVVAALRSPTAARVVLGTDTDDSAALWIGSISYLLSPGTCRTVGFSSYERAAGVIATLAKGVHLVAIPREDLAELNPREDVVILDEHEQVELGDLDEEPHRTTAGSTVEVSPLSVMAQVVLSDAGQARGAFAALDQMAERVGDRELDPAWPLAMTIVDQAAVFPDAIPAATAIVAAHSPSRLRDSPDLFGAASAVLRREMGTTTANAWSLLSSASGSNSVLTDVMLDAYLTRAVADPQWLRDTNGPLPRNYVPRATMCEHLVDCLDRAGEQLNESATGNACPDPLERAADAVRLVDFAARAGLTDSLRPASAEDLDPLESLLRRHVVPLLLDADSGPDLVPRLPPASRLLRTRYLGPLINAALAQPGYAADRPIGERLRPPVVAWLVPDGLAPSSLAGLNAGRVPGPLDAEYAVLRVARLESVDDPAYQALLLTALWCLLEDADRRPRLARRDLIEGLHSDSLTAEEVLALEQRFSESVGDPILLSALLRQPWSNELDILTSRIGRRPNPPSGSPLADLAALRRTLSEFGSESLAHQRMAGIADRAVREVGVLLDGRLDPGMDSDTCRRLVSATFISVLRASSGGLVDRIGDQNSHDPRGGHHRRQVLADPRFWSFMRAIARHADLGLAADDVVLAVRSKIIPPDTMVRAGIVAAPDFPVSLRSLVEARHLYTLASDPAGSTPLFTLALAKCLRTGSISMHLDEVNDIVMREVETKLALEPKAERDLAVSECRKYTKSRWRELRGSEAGLFGRARGKVGRGDGRWQ